MHFFNTHFTGMKSEARKLPSKIKLEVRSHTWPIGPSLVSKNYLEAEALPGLFQQ